MLTELTKREPLSLHETPCSWTVGPLAGKTTDWRAGCGRSARPVRREGGSKPIDAPYPYSIRSGTVCQVRAGAKHSLRNLGEDNLLVLAIYDPPRKRIASSAPPELN